MKVFVPRNIEKGRFNMHFQIGPLSVSLFQLILVAIGASLGLLTWNMVIKSGGNKFIATILALPIIGVFLFIAFFKISELPLVPFLAKLWRTRFLDTTKKMQRNSTNKIDPLDVMLKSNKVDFENEKRQEPKKTFNIDEIEKKKLPTDDLLS